MGSLRASILASLLFLAGRPLWGEDCNSSPFVPAVGYRAGVRPSALAVADLDLDGRTDLAVTDWESARVAVLGGTGAGALLPKVDFLTGPNPLSVAAADLDGDGLPDLAVACWGGGVSVLWNTSTAQKVSFKPAATFGAGSGPASVAA